MKLIISICLVFALAVCVGATEIQPLAMNNRAIGGGALNSYTLGVEDGAGLNNIGLLIKVWGEVTAVDTTNSLFYINDGSNLSDGSGYTGVRVSYGSLASGNTITPPSVGDHVTVVCISSTVAINSVIRPNLRPRQQSDIDIF
ncbi:MAG: hypothetical protein ABFD49_02110 [Armatimonadota bacterium]|nr:hypothetical protein [bacterium]